MNTLQKQFSDALKREKKFVTTYYNNETVSCLFRKINDNNNTTNHIQIFYDIDSPIKQGQIITYGGKNFITLNQETVENNIYYKSSLIECNVTIPVSIKGMIRQIPCYSHELNSAYTIKSNMINLVDGSGELLTEFIPELSIANYINKGLRIMGGYYKVVNIYDLNGINHLMIERDGIPADTYSFILTSDTTSYIKGETTQLTALAMVNDTQDTTATITYSSDNETVATVDDNGLVTFNGVGNVTITSTWVEQSLIKTLGFTVVADPDTPAHIFTLTCSNPNNEITVGGLERYITATLTDSNSNEVDFTPVWTFDFGVMSESYFTITDTDTKIMSIKVGSNYDYIGETLTITCTTSDGLYTESIDMLIMV